MNRASRPSIVRARGEVDRVVVVLGDIEMGAGGPPDDFPHDRFLIDLLGRYLAPPFEDLALEIVFNGDTFDLLKTGLSKPGTDGAWPRHVTRGVALAKLARVEAAHGIFFDGLADLLARGGDRIKLHFVAGNHDLELLFPEVQAAIRARIGGDDRVGFHGHELDLGRLHVEHGSQRDPLFRVDPGKPFLELGGEPILNLSWAAVALLDVAMPLQPLLFHHDRLRPKRVLFGLMPELEDLLRTLAWNYWTKSFWREVWAGTDPVKRVSWTMVKEVLVRLVSREVEVAMDDDLQRRLARAAESDDPIQLSVLGHQHDPGWWSSGDRKVLRTGAFRDEYMLLERGAVQRPINKTWVEAFLRGDEVVRSHLVEEVGPPRPKGTEPPEIFDVLPQIRALLPSPATRKQDRAAQQAREAVEAAQGEAEERAPEPESEPKAGPSSERTGDE